MNNLIKLFLITSIISLYSCKSSNNNSKIDKIQVKGIVDKVEVLRDQWGINHIYANNQNDLFFSQGYLAAYLFMNLGAFSCVILFSLRTGSDRITDYSGLYQKDPLITLGLSLCLLSLGGLPPMLGFFGKIYLFFAGWANHQYLLVVVGLITSVISIYYYISVIKMMVVKEPQEASEIVKSYPEIKWNIIGLPPLRIALYTCIAVTALGGILSNPLFKLANSAVSETPFLQDILATTNNVL